MCHGRMSFIKNYSLGRYRASNIENTAHGGRHASTTFIITARMSLQIRDAPVGGSVFGEVYASDVRAGAIHVIEVKRHLRIV